MLELQVPDEMKELMFDWKVAIECRDVAIASMFKAKRAIYYGKLAEKANRKFWTMVHELYPETKSGEWHYVFTEQVLRKADAT